MIKQNLSRIAAATLVLFLCAASGDDAPVSYGPDSLVDLTPSLSYAEPAIAVSPSDPRALIGGSMVFGTNGITMETFRSDDGGYNWKSTTLPTGNGSLLGDVQAAFDADGVAYMTGLGSQITPAGTSKNGLYVFKSFNQGETFQRAAFFQTPLGHSYDHEQLAIDRTSSPYRGRIYMTVLYEIQQPPHQVNQLGLVWSADGGHTFHGPVPVSTGWSFNSRPVVFSNGAVLFPFFKWNVPKEIVEVARSTDGGRTFAAPVVIGKRVVFTEKEEEHQLAVRNYAFDGDSVPQYAGGRDVAGNADVVYTIWSDVRTGTSRLLFAKSVDQGKHWTSPRVVFTTNDASDAQYQPSINLNKAGIVGISWFNGSMVRNTVSEMFAISSDDGETFSSPVAISSVLSPLKTPAALQYSALALNEPEGAFFDFTTPGARYPSGGDYMDLASDPDGGFHPIWIDSRTGVNQVWTATVFPRPPAPIPAGLSQRDVTKTLQVKLGAGTWDGAKHELTVPMRLHNASHDALYPPFTLSVTLAKNPYFKGMREEVTVLNADNGKPGVGATFTFSAQTVGNLARLMPGADTSSRTIKLRIANNAVSPTLIAHVTAYAP